MELLLLHLIGDYITQNHWIAVQKTKRWLWAIVHGVIYSLPFALLTTDIRRLTIISITHILIDRLRLANYIAKIKNWNWKTNDGYPGDTPDWLRVWLMIIADNTLHLVINYLAIHKNRLI
jgi:hypothetical protein